MTMLSFNQIQSNYSKKLPCERGCSWIIKFSHCLNFGYYKYGIIIFSIRTQNGCACCTNKEKTLKLTTFVTFLRRVNFILNFF